MAAGIWTKITSGRSGKTTAGGGPLRKILLLFLIALLLYGSVIAIDEVVIKGSGMDIGQYADLPVYRERTETILHGGLLYRDVHTETPPLINYLLVPAEVLGGAEHDWVYAAYFSFFGFLSSVVIYLGTRAYGERLAFRMAALFMALPFNFVETGLGADEALVAFTIVVPAVLLLNRHSRSAAVTVGLGIWTKMWAVLMLPAMLIKAHDHRERAFLIVAVLTLSALIALPFLILCDGDFIWFLRFYFLGVSDRDSGGSSVLHFLGQGGLAVPGVIELAVTALFLLAAMWIIYRKKLGMWESLTLMFVAFFAVYPKMYTAYYIFPMLFLLAWAVDDRKILARCALLYVPVMLSAGFVLRENGTMLFDFGGSWMVGLVLSAISSLLLLETAHTAMKRRPFLSRGEGADVGPSDRAIGEGTAAQN